MKCLERLLSSTFAVAGMACALLVCPLHAQQSDAVFSGGTSKSTVTPETNSGLRSLGSSWGRNPPSGLPADRQASNQFPPSAVVRASAEQLRSDLDQRAPTAAQQTGQPMGESAGQGRAPVSQVKAPQRIALSGPGETALDTEGRSGGTLQTILSVGSSLLIVVGLFLGVAWCYRRTLSSSVTGGLPNHVVNVLGRTPLAARQQLVLVRFGSKLVLVSLVQGDARPISEITDPLEVDRLSGLCESQQPGSITQSFRNVLNQGHAT